jgi:two-component system cell cycle sensor histidine kinase/response regulator CckA
VHELSDLIGQLPIGVWVAEVPSGTAAYTNRAFEAILGVGATRSSQIEDAPTTYGIYDRSGKPYPVEELPFSRVVRTGQAVVVDDLVIHRRDGSRVNVRAFAHPILSAAGALTHVSIVFIDITREVYAELERDRAAARVSFIVEHSPVAVWSADQTGCITLSQGAGLASPGVQSGDLVGQNVFELYAWHPTIGGYIRRALAGESLQYVVEVGDAAFDTWLSPMRDAKGSVVGVNGVSHDIRELRRLQAAGAQIDRTAALGTLASSVAHEINNPLTYVLYHGEQIEAGLEQLEGLCRSHSPDAVLQMRTLLVSLRDDFQTLRLGTERIASITRELRTFNHPDDKATGAVDVRAAVLSVLQLVGKELEARARLSLQLDETAPIEGHAARVAQVVLNLIMNAMQALPANAAHEHEIGISTATRDGHVVIEVSDSGPGVPVQDRERIFEPFVTTKPIGEGTGLGLFVCRNIVRGYTGEVSVQDRPGGGALFRVVLPAAGASLPAPTALLQKPPSEHAAAHILIIDDDVQVANALSGQLKRAGYRASTCSSGASGLRRMLATEDIDLVFCDLMMKGVTGMDVHARLLEQAPALLPKVVFMTGGACSTGARQFVLDHADAVIEKPFNLLAETRRRLVLS